MRLGILDMRWALRLDNNPLIKACLNENRVPLFIYPFEEGINQRFIKGISSNNKRTISICISNLKSQLKDIEGNIYIISPSQYPYLLKELEIYKDKKVFCTRHYPCYNNKFSTFFKDNGVDIEYISEVLITLNMTATFKNNRSISKSLSSFNQFINRDLIISKFKYDKALIKPVNINLSSDIQIEDIKDDYINKCNQWFIEGINSYNPDMIKSINKTSELGIYLKHGNISRQDVFIKARMGEGDELEGNHFFCKSLLKRDYIYAIACLKVKNINVGWKELSKSSIDNWVRWLKQETDNKLCNAGMYQLRVTGYIPYPIRLLLIRTALSLNIPKWLILETLNYLLNDSDEVINSYYLNNNNDSHFNFVLMEYIEKGYISLNNPNSSSVKIEPIQYRTSKII